MPYVSKKANKDRPNSPGAVVVDCPEYLVVWKFKTRKPPKPRRWANLVVYLKAAGLKRRSFHVSWSASRFAHSAAIEFLQEHHPEVVPDLWERLRPAQAKMVKPMAEDDEDNDQETWG